MTCPSIHPETPLIRCERDVHSNGLHTNGFGPGMIMWTDPDNRAQERTKVAATDKLNQIRNRTRKEHRVR